MKKKLLEIKSIESVPVITILAPIVGERGEEITRALKEILDHGDNKFIIDFTCCTIIDSQGVVKTLSAVFSVVMEHQGEVIFTGIDQLKFSVFNMVGMFEYAQVASDLNAACQLIKIS